MTKRTRISFRQTTDVFPEVERWATVTGFSRDVALDSGRLYKKGRGVLLAPMRLSVRQAGGVVEMEAWIPINIFTRIMSLFMLPSEMGIESGGFRGVMPRRIARNAINGLLRQLGQEPIP